MKGWFGNRQQHGLASKGIKSSFRRFKGDMLSKDETWVLRDRFMQEFGYFDKYEFENWVHNTTDKTPYHSEFHREGHTKLMAFGWDDKLHNVYSDFEEWEAYSEMYGLHRKLGYDTPEEAWEDNPHIKGSVKPEEYGIYNIASNDKKLQKIYENLGDIVEYKGKVFTQIFYGMDVYPTDKYPTRSKEIIWQDKDGNQIYLFEDKIEYISGGV